MQLIATPERKCLVHLLNDSRQNFSLASFATTLNTMISTYHVEGDMVKVSKLVVVHLKQRKPHTVKCCDHAATHVVGGLCQ